MITLIKNAWPMLLGVAVGYAVMLAGIALLLMISWNLFATSGIVPAISYVEAGGLVGLLVLLRLVVVRPMISKSPLAQMPRSSTNTTKQPIKIDDEDVETFELPADFMEAVQNAMREKEFIDNLAKAPLKRPEKLD